VSAVVSLQGVTKRVADGAGRRTILEDVTLEVPEGKLWVIIGPSGSGKSTLLSIAGAMSLPTTGTVTLLGEPVGTLRDEHRAELRRRAVGFVFQELGLIASMTLAENLALPLVPTGGPTAADDARMRSLLATFELTAREHDRAATASGGERQRLAIARALVRDPKLLILDEPTAHLDQASAERVLSLLVDRKAEGRALLVSTHDPRVSEHAGVDRVVRLSAGRIE
jgi:putative ABC transport system ATP-binding protein